jgi:hypothetical protein
LVSNHQANGGKAQESERLAIAIFPILGQSSPAIDPRDYPLDDPSLELSPKVGDGENRKAYRGDA